MAGGRILKALQCAAWMAAASAHGWGQSVAASADASASAAASTPATTALGKPLAPYAPMTGRERWRDFVTQNFNSPGAFLRTGVTAAADQIGDAPPEWGTGIAGFGERTGAEFGRFTMGGVIQSSSAALLGDDTRYFPCACTGVLRRSTHAVLRTFFTLNHAGHRTVDLPGLAGSYGGAIFMVYLYPSRYSALGDGVRYGSINLAVLTGIDVLKEFAPEFKRRLIRRHKGN